MRPGFTAIASVIIASTAASAQNASVRGNVVLRDDGQPLGYTTVSLVAQGIQRLASDSGTFTLFNVAPGVVRLRFTRIGFAPKDTALLIGAGETAQLRIEMMRLEIQLPAEVVSGACTDQTPYQPKPGVLAELFEQVQQNAERMILLASAKPFVMHTVQEGGFHDPTQPFVPTRFDTVARGPLALVEYEPRRVARPGEGRYRGSWGIHVPELPDFASSAFRNTHCFRYAGQTRLDGDSVIALDFEPVPWLAKEVDIEGTLYLRVDGYQLVGIDARLNRLPRNSAHIEEYTHRTRFREVVPGIPVLVSWELRNVFRNGSPPFVARGRVVDVRWSDSSPLKVDTMDR